jgi:hypothetical protein
MSLETGRMSLGSYSIWNLRRMPWCCHYQCRGPSLKSCESFESLSRHVQRNALKYSGVAWNGFAGSRDAHVIQLSHFKPHPVPQIERRATEPLCRFYMYLVLHTIDPRQHQLLFSGTCSTCSPASSSKGCFASRAARSRSCSTAASDT